MELLDRDTFLEWMEQIMSRFDHLKQTIPDIPQRPMLNGEPLLDNQDVCQILNISLRTLQTYRSNRMLPYTQIGYKMFYKPEDVGKLLEQSSSL